MKLGFLKCVEGERRQRGEAASIAQELDERIKVHCVSQSSSTPS